DEDALGEQAWRWLAQAFAMPALLATPPRTLSGIALPPSRLTAGEKFAALLGASGVRQDDAERARHAAAGGLADLLRLRAGDLSSVPDAVLYPCNEGDVLAVLKLCTERGIAVVPFGGGTGDVTPARGGHGAVVTLNLSGLNRVTTLDRMSGLAEVEAGITGAELERQMTARGVMPVHWPDAFEFSSLGGWIAQPGATATDWLRGLRVATPQGLLTGHTRPGPDLKQVMWGSRGALGVITSATIRIRALPEKEETRAYLFPDFASGLAAVREAQRTGLGHSLMRLSDDGETRFSRALQRPTLGEHFFDVYLSIRHFDSHAARLVVDFSGSDHEVRAARKRFDRLAKSLGALALGNWQRQRLAARRDALLDRGIGMDAIAIPASWSELPSLYVKLRAALKQAMRAHVPRPGAHGLVLCQVGPAWPDGANLTVTWLFPRKLDDEIAQAQTIRAAALAALPTPTGEVLEQGVLRAIKQALDPQGILNPGTLV
ncbi:MAG TPA: FAD-binding oxidoreductase, partial [Rhizomicrobium sp.]|nr:FAD-binding oxidoreductase [Rhizomicrobium sp.]